MYVLYMWITVIYHSTCTLYVSDCRLHCSLICVLVVRHIDYADLSTKTYIISLSVSMAIDNMYVFIQHIPVYLT